MRSAAAIIPHPPRETLPNKMAKKIAPKDWAVAKRPMEGRSKPRTSCKKLGVKGQPRLVTK